MYGWKFTRTGKRVPWVLLPILCLILCSAGVAAAESGEDPAGQKEYVRTVDGSPSLADMEKGQGWSYNGEYLYALTRGVRDSTMPAGAKVVVFVPAFVVDTAFLPVALIFGLFGH